MRKLTTEEFIEKAKEIHGDRFDYSHVEYKGSFIKVKIFCKEKNKFFLQPAGSHTRGRGCPCCRNLNKKGTTKEFIERSILIHGYKYDYSQSVYTGVHDNIKVICSEHGMFQISPNNHFKGSGCPTCSNRKLRHTTESFIEKARSIHGDKYDYSEVKYTLCFNNISVICKKHGRFKVKAQYHISSNNLGCPYCSKEAKVKKLRMAQDVFIKRCIEKNGDKYNYTSINYTKMDDNINVICKTHGIFSTTAKYFYDGHGCKKCQYEHNSEVGRSNKEEFTQKAIVVHGGKYDYSKVDYVQNKVNVEIICKKHNKIFAQSPNSHLRGNGCPVCKSSVGETLIYEILDRLNVGYIREYSFIGKGKYRLRHDFYLPDYKLAIEYNGIQHFSPVEFFGGLEAFIGTKKRDIVKKHYCLNNGINFLEIPYWRKDEIETIIKDRLMELSKVR